MALPVKDQLKYWGIATAVFLLVLWFLDDVILPFILGGALAYCLDPIADRLEKAGLSRVASVFLILLVSLYNSKFLARALQRRDTILTHEALLLLCFYAQCRILIV